MVPVESKQDCQAVSITKWVPIFPKCCIQFLLAKGSNKKVPNSKNVVFMFRYQEQLEQYGGLL